jgi:hypothetical protein
MTNGRWVLAEWATSPVVDRDPGGGVISVGADLL